MSSPNIEIHEFSTGIHVQKKVNGWVSLGFTGKYMNATINPIPPVVEKSIANQEFALTKGSSTEKPAIIGRIVESGDDTWSVMAVVTRGQDEVGLSAAFYRYFLCQGDHNLRFILAWWEQNQKPTFNPLDFKSSPHLFMGESGLPDVRTEDESLPFEQDQAIVLPAENQHDLYTLNALAIAKFNRSKNGLPVAWAFNVQALEKPELFQVIQPASQKAYEQLKQAIANAGQVTQALRPAIRKLIHSSQVKPEAVGVIVAGLENENVTAEDWETLFNKEGAEIAIKQKIYSPQLVRLITLRAIVNPKTLPQFLAWLNIQGGRKPDQHQTISLELQKAIRGLLPKEQLAKGIKYLLLDLLNQKISVDSLCWLLTTNGSAWVYARKKFITDVKYDLQLICDYGLLNKKLFKCRKQIWASLISNWRSIQKETHKSEEYQPLAELLARLKEYELAAYFYQVSQGNVANDLFYKMAYEKYLQIHPHPTNVPYQKYRNSHITVYGLQIKRKPTLIEFIDHVLDFITLEVDMKIQFVIPLSLLILVSGWFIGAKSWESSTDKTDIEKSLDSKTFKKDDKNNNREIVRSELKDKQKAIDDYTQAININPNDADAYNNRGLVRSELGDKQGAIDDYNQAIKINPNYAPAYNNRGIVRYELGNKPGAIDDYTQAIKFNPNLADAYNNRGIVRNDLGDKQEAIDDYNLAIKFNPNLADAYNNRGVVRYELGDKQEAIDDYNLAIKFNPNDALAYNNRGLVRYELGNKQEAIDDYNLAIKINPNLALAYNNRGNARNDLGNKQGAIDDFNQAIKINPNLALAYNNRGNARNDLGNKQGAIDDFNQAIKINPKYALAYNNRGFVRYELGNKPGAIDDYNLAIKINPNLALAYNNRGNARNDLGNKQGAIDDFNQAIKINPNADAYYNRGNARNDLGNKQGAIDDFQQAAKLYQQQGKNQDYQDALNRIKELQQ